MQCKTENTINSLSDRYDQQPNCAKYIIFTYFKISYLNISEIKVLRQSEIANTRQKKNAGYFVFINQQHYMKFVILRISCIQIKMLHIVTTKKLNKNISMKNDYIIFLNVAFLFVSFSTFVFFVRPFSSSSSLFADFSISIKSDEWTHEKPWKRNIKTIKQKQNLFKSKRDRNSIARLSHVMCNT